MFHFHSHRSSSHSTSPEPDGRAEFITECGGGNDTVERNLWRIFPDQNQKKSQNPMPVMTMPTGNQTTGNEYGRGIDLKIMSHCHRGRREERKRSPDPVGITTPPIGIGLAHLRGHVTDSHGIDDHPIPDLVQDPGKKK